jgi:hypothetical protein
LTNREDSAQKYERLYEEYKNEMERFHNVKKYVFVLKDQLVDFKRNVEKLVKLIPK